MEPSAQRGNQNAVTALATTGLSERSIFAVIAISASTGSDVADKPEAHLSKTSAEATAIALLAGCSSLRTDFAPLHESCANWQTHRDASPLSLNRAQPASSAPPIHNLVGFVESKKGQNFKSTASKKMSRDNQKVKNAAQSPCLPTPHCAVRRKMS